MGGHGRDRRGGRRGIIGDTARKGAGVKDINPHATRFHCPWSNLSYPGTMQVMYKEYPGVQKYMLQ